MAPACHPGLGRLCGTPHAPFSIAHCYPASRHCCNGHLSWGHFWLCLPLSSFPHCKSPTLFLNSEHKVKHTHSVFPLLIHSGWQAAHSLLQTSPHKSPPAPSGTSKFKDDPASSEGRKPGPPSLARQAILRALHRRPALFLCFDCQTHSMSLKVFLRQEPLTPNRTS